MSFKNRLFDIIEDEPIINALVINLGPFKKLYKLDTSDDKTKYKNQLMYCFLVGDYESPIYNLEVSMVSEEACNLSFGSRNVARNITKTLNEAVDLYKKCQTTVERRTLESSMSSCDSLNKNLENMKNSSETLASILSQLDGEIKAATIVDEKVELYKTKQELEQSTLTNNKLINDLVTKSSKMLDTIAELRAKANKSHGDLESSIGDFIIDEFLDEYAQNIIH
jgi:hypothetical protein